jgi:N-acetylmuramoyl-L-alanine amidase
VVLNRVASSEFPKTVRGVIFQHGQFDPVANGSIYDKPTDEAVESAKLVLMGETVLNKKVLYFYDRKTTREYWILRREVAEIIGSQAFCY